MKNISLFLRWTLGFLFMAIISGSPALSAEFHVTDAAGFQNALNTARNNGEDDTIYLAAGTYQGSFSYRPSNTEHKALTITGEPGTLSGEIILDGQNLNGVLSLYDDYSTGPLVDINIIGITIQNGLGNGGASGLRMRFLQEFTNVSITNCIITNNSGPGYGAGIVIEGFPGGNVTLENNLILNNTVTEEPDGTSNGGGVAILYDGGGQITIRNNIMANNSASGTTASQGGGLWISGGSLHLIGNTIYNNQANKGGGVYLDYPSAANVYNNIIYGNAATQGGDIYFTDVNSGTGRNNNYSVIYGTWADFGDNLDINPLFADPSNNDFHLQANSPMINAGTTAVPTPPGLPSTDFEGNLRVIGPFPDIGAYEFGVLSLTPDEGTIGTEIDVYGSGFGTKRNKILIGTRALKILKWTDGWIHASLYKALPPGIYDMAIQPRGASSIVLEGAFTVKAPEIGSVEPGTGSVNDEIIIHGLFFGNKRGKVTLGGKNCRIKTWTSEIHFVVPRGLSAGAHELKVTNGVGSDTTTFTVE